MACCGRIRKFWLAFKASENESFLTNLPARLHKSWLKIMFKINTIQPTGWLGFYLAVQNRLPVGPPTPRQITPLRPQFNAGKTVQSSTQSVMLHFAKNATFTSRQASKLQCCDARTMVREVD
jgi:hypothetical protein